MRCWTMVLCVAGVAACGRAPAERPAPHAAAPAKVALRPQPKPGERVRQPELDGYCGRAERPMAFYYHGGSPVAQVARKHGCTPLYITDCEGDDGCYPPRDQEPGMWCCAEPNASQESRAER